MEGGKKKTWIVAMTAVGATLGCCLFGMIAVIADDQPESTPTASAASSSAPSAPEVTAPPPPPAWEQVARQISEGASPDASVCAEAVLGAPIGTPTEEIVPKLWPLFECARGHAPKRAATTLRVLELLVNLSDEERQAVEELVPEEHRPWVNEELMHLATHFQDTHSNIIEASAFELERRDLQDLLAVAETLATVCPACGRRRELRRAKRSIERRMDDVPAPVESTRAMRLRYADLKGQPVLIEGSVEARSYYNCKFRSQSRWRAMAFRSQGEFGSRLTVYCRRGQETCERIYSQSIDGPVGIEAILRYPRANGICEESQAELLEAR